MSKKITQETFNEAVNENMEIFSMGLEESIKATIDQFKAQGVSLFGVVTDPAVVNNEHPVRLLKAQFENEDDEQKKASIVKEFENLVKKDSAYKTSCGEFKIINMCLDAILSSTASSELKKAVMEFLLVLLDGYPDLADEQACFTFLNLLDNENDDLKYGLKLIIITCVKHEVNRQRYMVKNVVEKLKKIISQQPSDDILILVCRVVSVLSLDDDTRSEVSKAYIHACKISDVLLKPFCRFLKVKKEVKTLRYILKAMTSIVVNYDYCSDVEEDGGLTAVICILEKHRDNEILVTQCFKLLTSLAGNDVVKDKLMKFDIAQEIHRALNQYIHSKTHVNAALTLISKISLRSPEYGKIFFKLDFPPLIIQAFKLHPYDLSIQASGCWCIRNMASRNPEYHCQFLAVGAEEELNRILKDNRCCSYDAKIALQELGCSVAAREPWTGQKGDKVAQSSNN